jgi:hypothetical protein
MLAYRENRSRTSGMFDSPVHIARFGYNGTNAGEGRIFGGSASGGFIATISGDGMEGNVNGGHAGWGQDSLRAGRSRTRKWPMVMMPRNSKSTAVWSMMHSCGSTGMEWSCGIWS